LCAIVEHTSLSGETSLRSVGEIFELLLSALRFDPNYDKNSPCPTNSETKLCAMGYEPLFKAIAAAYGIEFQYNKFSDLVFNLFGDLNQGGTFENYYCQNLRKVRNIYAHNSVDVTKYTNYQLLKHELQALVALVVILDRSNYRLSQAVEDQYQKILPKLKLVIQPDKSQNWYQIALFDSADLNREPLGLLQNSEGQPTQIEYADGRQLQQYWIGIKTDGDAAWELCEVKTKVVSLEQVTYVVYPPSTRDMTIEEIRSSYEKQQYSQMAATHQELDQAVEKLSIQIRESKGITLDEAKQLVKDSIVPLIDLAERLAPLEGMEERMLAQQKKLICQTEKRLLATLDKVKDIENLRDDVHETRKEVISQYQKMLEHENRLGSIERAIHLETAFRCGLLVCIALISLIFAFAPACFLLTKALIAHQVLFSIGLVVLLVVVVWCLLPLWGWRRLGLSERICMPLSLAIILGVGFYTATHLPAYCRAELTERVQHTLDIDLLTLAYDLDIDDSAYLLALRDTDHSGEWFKKARIQYRTIQERDSTDTHSAFRLAQLCRKGQGGTIDLTQAKMYARRAQRTPRGSALYAMICAELGATEEAQRQIEHSKMLWPEVSDPLLGMAEFALILADSTNNDVSDTLLLESLANEYLPLVERCAQSNDLDLRDEALLLLTGMQAFGKMSDDGASVVIAPSLAALLLGSNRLDTSRNPRLFILYADWFKKMSDFYAAERLYHDAWLLGCSDAALMIAMLQQYIPQSNPAIDYAQVKEEVQAAQNTNSFSPFYFVSQYLQQGEIEKAIAEAERLTPRPGTYMEIADSSTYADTKETMRKLITHYNLICDKVGNAPSPDQVFELLSHLDVALSFANPYSHYETAYCLYDLYDLYSYCCLMDGNHFEQESFELMLEILRLAGINDDSIIQDRIANLRHQVNHSDNTPGEIYKCNQQLDLLGSYFTLAPRESPVFEYEGTEQIDVDEYADTVIVRYRTEKP